MTDDRADRLGGRPLALLDRLLERVEWATVVVAGVVIFIVMLVGVAEILLRKLANSPLYGQLDLIEQTMATYALLPISYCWRKAGHIRVDLVIDRFGGRARWIVELLTTLVALFLIAVMWPGILHFFQNAWEIGDSTINTRWPTWPSKSVPIAAFTILLARLALEAVGFLRLVIDPEAAPVAVPKRHDPVEEALEEAEEIGLDNAEPPR